MYNRKPMGKKKEAMEATDPSLSFSQIMKDVALLGSSNMTWKDRKALENQRVIELGGKPQKKQRLPLNVARVQMKKQKEREEKMSEQNMILGRFGGLLGGVSTKKPVEKKRKPEDRVLKSTVGNFKGGVLDVRHMLHPGSSRSNEGGNDKRSFGKIGLGGGEEGKGRRKKNGKKKGKKKGGGKRKGK
ncbi:unnamed protein product [Cochlearia groenlandica]